MSQMKKAPISPQPKKAAAGDFISHSHGGEAAKKASLGIVGVCVHGSSGTGKSFSVAKIIQALKAGLPVRELDDLRSNLDLPMDRLVPMLGISKATLHRRKNAGRLDAAESDRVVRFARLLGRAATVMESLDAGRRWLSSRQVGLGGAVPLEYAETEVGAREVENLLGRIECGVYS